MPLLIAEELDIEPLKITVEILPYDSAKAGNYTTWASASIKDSWMHLRNVGATAKAMLIKAAALRWKLDANECKSDNGKIINTLNGDYFLYKELIRDASSLEIPVKVALKEVKDFKLIGKKIQKNNTSSIVSGKYKYTMDVKLPGMLFAALVRCPEYSGKLKTWDSSKLSNIKGFVKTVRVLQMNEAMNRNAIAIIATNSWAALQGQRLLTVEWEWSNNPDTVRDSLSLFQKFKSELATAQPARVYSKEKNNPFIKLGGSEVLEATYEVQYLAHSTMEPMNCIL